MASSFLEPAQLARWRQRIKVTTHANYHYHMGAALHRTGDTQNALNQFQEALNVDPTCSRARCDAIALAQEIGQSALAERLLADGMAIDPNFLAIAALEAAGEIDDTDAALASLNHLSSMAGLEHTPASLRADTFRHLGNLLRKGGRARDAGSALEMACAADPRDVKAYADLASYFLAVMDQASLTDCLARWMAVAPDDAAAHSIQGQFLVLQKRYDAADAAFAEAQRLGSKQPLLAVFRGRIRLVQGDYADAITMFSAGGSDWIAKSYALLARLQLSADAALLPQADEWIAASNEHELPKLVKCFVLKALNRHEEWRALLNSVMNRKPSCNADACAAILKEGDGAYPEARVLLQRAMEHRGPFLDFAIDCFPGGREAVSRLLAG